MLSLLARQVATFSLFTAAGIINVLLDPIFVFLLDMGVAGAGAATCLSNWVIFCYYLRQHNRRRGTSVVSFALRNWRGRGVASQVLTVGVPAGLVLFLTNICDFVRNYCLRALGSEIKLAAWGAAQKISNALMMIMVGIAQGVRPLLAYNFASGRFPRARAWIRGAFTVVLCCIAMALLLIQLFPSAIVRLFVTEPAAVQTAVYFLRRWTFALVGLGALELFNAIFQAMGRWKLSLTNVLVNKGVLLTPMLILLVRLLGAHGVAYSQVLTENLTAIVTAFVYLYLSRRWDRRVRPQV